MLISKIKGLPRWLSGKESACQKGDLGLIPRVEKREVAFMMGFVATLEYLLA